MSLVVAIGPFCDKENVAMLLKATKASMARLLEFPEQAKNLQLHLESDTQNTVLFLYANMADVVSSIAYTNAAIPPNAAVEYWQQALQKIKQVLRAYPSQSLLCELGAALDQPLAFLQKYTEITQANDTEFEIAEPLRKQDQLALLVAEKWAEQYPALLHTQQQLTALAIPFPCSEEAITVSAQAAMQQLQTQFCDQRQLRQALEHAQQQAIMAQNAEQSSRQGNEALSQELYRAQKKLEQLHHALNASHKAEKESKEEADILLAELHRVQEELEQQNHELSSSQVAEQQLQYTLQSTKAALTQQKQELHALRSELTKAHQQIQSATCAEKKSKEEAELILEELHRVQEQLEQHYLQKNSLSNHEQNIIESTQLVVASPVSTGREKASKRGFFSKRRTKHRMEKKAQLLVESGLFEVSWYLNTYPDVAADSEASRNPALHYLKYGGFEGRNPGPEFDSSYYLNTYPDVAESGINPLWHYIKMGRKEGRKNKP